MLIVFVLGSVLVSSVFLSCLWFFFLFLLLSFFLFLLVWSFFYLFSFWFFFLEFFLLCVRFPLSLFSYEKCFCAHVQTWPRRYRDHADHEPDDPGPGWEVRNEDSISARLSLRAVWTIRVRMRRLNSGLSVFGVGLSRSRRSCPGSDIGWWFVFQALWTRPVINGP